MAVIFDMNGVIVDDEPVHELAFREVCGERGLALTHEEYAQWCLGKTDEAGFEALVRHRGLPGAVAELVAEKSRRYWGLIPRHIREVPGAAALIRRLHGRYPLSLASGAHRDEVRMVLRRFGIAGCFQAIVSAEDVRRGKPDPESYLLAAQKLRVPPEACLVIEDSVPGIRAAKAAGMRCIAVTTSHRAEDLREADLVVGRLVDIAEDVLAGRERA